MSTHHLHTGLKLTTSLHQASLHTDLTILTQDFKHYPFLTYIYITNIILTEILIIFNCCRMTVTQLTTFVPFYSCNNITLKIAATAAETCW